MKNSTRTKNRLLSHRLALLGLAALAMLSGCGSCGKNPFDSTKTNACSDPYPTAHYHENLVGNWVGCQKTVAGIPQSAAVTYSFDHLNFKFEGAAKNSSDCSGDKRAWKVRATGSYTIGTQDSKVTQAIDMEFVVETFSVSLSDPDAVAYFNSRAICGYADWILDVEKKELSAECITQFSVGTGLLPHTLYSITDAGLFLGEARDPIDGIKSEDRPNHLAKIPLRR